jgi:glycosidase
MRNVASLAAEPQSILNLFRRLIALRREHAALSVGRLVAVHADKDVLTFERSEGDTQLLIVLNFAHEQRQVEIPTDSNGALALLSTYLDRDDQHVQAKLELRPSEGVILKLAGAERTTP